MRYLHMMLLLAIAGTAQSQSYHNMMHDTAIWDENIVNQCDPAFGYADGYDRKLIMQGDTTINTHHYKKLYHQLYHSYLYQWQQLVFSYYFSDPPLLIGAVREDSSRKVYFLNLDTINFDPAPCQGAAFPHGDETLIYDFNLHVGDTVSWKPWNNVVTGIDSMLIADTVQLQVFRFDAMDDYWVESLGSKLGFFGAYLPPPFECNCSLHCAEATEYSLPGSLPCGGVYNAIQSVPSAKKAFTIFPNPASRSSKIAIGFEHRPEEISIRNAVGQIIATFEVNSQQIFEIPAYTFPGQGLFRVEFKTPEAESFYASVLIAW